MLDVHKIALAASRTGTIRPIEQFFGGEPPPVKIATHPGWNFSAGFTAPQFTWKAAFAVEWFPMLMETRQRRWMAMYFCLALQCDTPILEAINVALLEKPTPLKDTDYQWINCKCTACENVSQHCDPKYFWSTSDGPGCKFAEDWPRIDRVPFVTMVGRGLNHRDLELIASQTHSTYEQAVEAMIRCDADIVYAIMMLAR